MAADTFAGATLHIYSAAPVPTLQRALQMGLRRVALTDRRKCCNQKATLAVSQRVCCARNRRSVITSGTPRPG